LESETWNLEPETQFLFQVPQRQYPQRFGAIAGATDSTRRFAKLQFVIKIPIEFDNLFGFLI
jgi:hypothetical protein